MNFNRLSEINKERDKITSEIENLQNDLAALEREAKEIAKSASVRLSSIGAKVLHRVSLYYDTKSYNLVIRSEDPKWFYEMKSLSLTCALYNKHEKHLQDFGPTSVFHLSIPFSWLELDEGLLNVSIELAAIGRHRDFYDWLNRFCKPEQNRG